MKVYVRFNVQYQIVTLAMPLELHAPLARLDLKMMALETVWLNVQYQTVKPAVLAELVVPLARLDSLTMALETASHQLLHAMHLQDSFCHLPTLVNDALFLIAYNALLLHNAKPVIHQIISL